MYKCYIYCNVFLLEGFSVLEEFILKFVFYFFKKLYCSKNIIDGIFFGWFLCYLFGVFFGVNVMI